MRLMVPLLCILLAAPAVAAVELPPSPFVSHPSVVTYVGGATIPGNDGPGAGCYGTLQGEGLAVLGACFMTLPSASTFTIQVDDAHTPAVAFRWAVEVPQDGQAAGNPVVCAEGFASGSTTQPMPADCDGAYVTVELGTGATVGTITVS